MKTIQTDSFNADALVPNAGAGAVKEGVAKNAGKASGFRSLLTQFGGTHGKQLPAMPRRGVDEKSTNLSQQEAAEDAAPTSVAGLTSDATPASVGKVLPSEASEAMGTIPLPAADPAAPVLWAQMLMGQVVTTTHSTGESKPVLDATQMTPELRSDTPTSAPATTASLLDQIVMPATGSAMPHLGVGSGLNTSKGMQAVVQETPVGLGSSLDSSVGTEVPSFLKAAHMQSHAHGGSQGVSWMADLRSMATTASAQKVASEQAKASADTQTLQSPVPEVLVAAAQIMPMDALRADQKQLNTSSKGGLESGQALYSNQGLDMTTQANQSAANLGISATIPIDASPETAVANQVAVWVSQNVQSAELKLDAQGGDPVEVSISMAGNQATVEFRCDQPETREILNRAADELHAMLQNEGLVLLGVSVGTSNQDFSGKQSAASDQTGGGKSFRTSSNARGEQAAGQTLNLVPRVRAPTGAVDLFV